MEALMFLPTIDRDGCTGCGDCVEVCHSNALSLRNMRAMFANPQLCDYCSDCEAVCPVDAIVCPLEVVLDEWSDAQRDCTTDPSRRASASDAQGGVSWRRTATSTPTTTATAARRRRS